MANPIEFQAKTDPRQELHRKLEAAPQEHAEALLVAFDVLEAAHQKGILDLMHGVIGSKNSIISTVAEYASAPESTQTLRNLLIALRLFGSLDPGALREIEATLTEHEDRKPPSIWQSLKVLLSRNGRRGLYSTALLFRAIGAIGRK